MREFPKSTTLSPNNGEFSSLAGVGRGYEPLGEPSVPPSRYPGLGPVLPTENNLDVFLRNLEFSNFEQQTHNWQMPGENMILWSGPENVFLNREAMEQRAFDIREKLKYTAATQNLPHAAPKHILEAIELMTAENVASYIKLYFRHWHKHAPMVHEATFNPCTAALPLVLALMSLGGMVRFVMVMVSLLADILY